MQCEMLTPAFLIAASRPHIRHFPPDKNMPDCIKPGCGKFRKGESTAAVGGGIHAGSNEK
jgi:hypothetical protein